MTPEFLTKFQLGKTGTDEPPTGSINVGLDRRRDAAPHGREPVCRAGDQGGTVRADPDGRPNQLRRPKMATEETADAKSDAPKETSSAAPAPAPVPKPDAPKPDPVKTPPPPPAPVVTAKDHRLMGLTLAVDMRKTAETKQMIGAAKAFAAYLDDGGSVDALKIALANHPADQATEIVNYAGVYQHYLETGEVQ